MPTYSMDGISLGPNGVINSDFELVTANGVTTLSYVYEDIEEGTIAVDIEGSFRLFLDGDRQGLNNTDVAIGELEWGAGRETTLVLATFGDGTVFIGATAGDALPNLQGDGIHVLAEFFTILDDSDDGIITSGPYRPGANISLNALFRDDSAGSVIKGTQKANTLTGNAKENLIIGQNGNDTADGKKGSDTLMMGRGNDTGYGGDGGDFLSGYLGNDRLWGGTGGDILEGADGRDQLYGGKGKDVLRGGAANDQIDGGKGNDTQTGNKGADTFVFGNGDDRDKITDFRNGGDRLELNDNLWAGNLTTQQVVSQFADKANGTITLDFGGGDVLVLKNYGGLGALEGFIDIV